MLLHVDAVSIAFGGACALSDVSFRVDGNGVKGLIGPNGAGKTTLFNVITGFYRADAGRVYLSGRDITRLRPHVIVRSGVGRTFQKPSLAWHLTVFENVLLGSMNNRVLGFAVRRSRRKEWTEECLRSSGIPKEAWQEPMSRAGILLVKKVEFARAVSLSPDLVLLDEICSGLSHDETDELLSMIRGHVERNRCGVLFVEHDLRAVRNICSDVVVLDFGSVIYDGDIGRAFEDRRVIEAYIGGADA
ncbi:MAG: ATP-binding cassette domain-containing protein [Deltaproteobacteria bacterium]|nr:ATP-binding cassette domain-containing protein [Deltaproteobacteria bacterium]